LSAAVPGNVLERIQRPSRYVEAFAGLRRADQSVFATALTERRSAWLVTGWGLGDEEFLQAVQERVFQGQTKAFHLELGDRFDRAGISDGVMERTGITLEQLLGCLSSEGDSFLVLHDLSVGEGTEESRKLEHEVELLVDAALGFCPSIKIVVCSRKRPSQTTLQVLELKPLDEPDTATYVRAHARGGPSYATGESLGRLFRHTDGVPARLDAVLRDLSVVGLRGLLKLDPDVTGRSVQASDAPPGLANAISELAKSSLQEDVRALALLKVLTIFPRGEQLDRVWRFYGAVGFYAGHASVLIDNAFLDAAPVASLGTSFGAGVSEDPVLVVRRPVRDYLYSIMSAEELEQLYLRAIELYFGVEWTTKGIRTKANLKYTDSRCPAWVLFNANTLVLRAVVDAVERTDVSKGKSALALSNAYVAALTSGSHYGSIVTLCNDLIPLFSRLSEDLDLTTLRLELSVALRMMGRREEARDGLVDLQAIKGNKSQLQSAQINLALVYQKLGDAEKAQSVAKKCIAVDGKSSLALQAQAVILEVDEQDEGRESSLYRLEKKARARKAFTVANNLALERASRAKDLSRRSEILEQMLANANGDGDQYNAMRGLLKLARTSIERGESITKGQLLGLVRAYSYCHDQRIESLFSQCHSVLWDLFERQADKRNLLVLFRQSSLIWRLRDQDAIEQRYISRLSRVLGPNMAVGYRSTDRELAYFLTRGISIMSRTQTMTSEVAQPELLN
jgi:tetratricopeptide (TPR) repeat protein